MKRRGSEGEQQKRFSIKMQKKLVVLFILVLAAFAALNVRLMKISKEDGDKYKKQVLSQQEYDSIVLPAKRGDIVDRKGTKMAVSEKVYNIVIDTKAMTAEEGKYLETSLRTMLQSGAQFEYTEEEIRNYMATNPTSQYRVVAKKQPYDNISSLMEILANKTEYPDVKGIWLENDYQRRYPYDTLACDVIGFVQGDNLGTYGLEEYYNDLLNGTNGREYGYLNDDENLERTIKPAEDGKTLVTTMDVNIQSIVEKHILAFNEAHKDEYREGNGSSNTGVIIMDPNNGEILAMASYPVYDLNNPRDLSRVTIPEEDEEDESDTEEPTDENADENTDGNTEENTDENADDTALEGATEGIPEGSVEGTVEGSTEDGLSAEAALLNGEPQSTSVSDNAVAELTPEEKAAKKKEEAEMEALAALWKNFCISDTYEPGSTAKPFTVAAGLESGELTGNESYECNGVLEVGGHEIHCNNHPGINSLTLTGALEHSCNVAMMKIAGQMGRSTFMKYNRLFNFGLRTNIDLTGETLTTTVVFDEGKMTSSDLAIGAFGQGFNATMIQMITGFCSLINGGEYYQPHVVNEVLTADGATVEVKEPRVLKQTVSAETSEKIKEMCVSVVVNGTGHSARPAGYMIGGKTGTAEKYPRKMGNYVVSFMGFAPADNPQLVIYVVIDEPNVAAQASARYATLLTRDILTEVLPYMKIYQTEPLTEEEQAELETSQQAFSAGASGVQETESTEEGAEGTTEGTEGTTEGAEGTTEGTGETTEGTGETTEGTGETSGDTTGTTGTTSEDGTGSSLGGL